MGPGVGAYLEKRERDVHFPVRGRLCARVHWDPFINIDSADQPRFNHKDEEFRGLRPQGLYKTNRTHENSSTEGISLNFLDNSNLFFFLVAKGH